MTQIDERRVETPSRQVIPNVHELAPKIRDAWQLLHAAWQEFTTLDPVTVDLCRLKSANLNDCKW
jgi:hypothetical protein